MGRETNLDDFDLVSAHFALAFARQELLPPA